MNRIPGTARAHHIRTLFHTSSTLSQFRSKLIIGHPRGCDDEESDDVAVRSELRPIQIVKNCFRLGWAKPGPELVLGQANEATSLKGELPAKSGPSHVDRLRPLPPPTAANQMPTSAAN